jgi:hypothetical protein
MAGGHCRLHSFAASQSGIYFISGPGRKGVGVSCCVVFVIVILDVVIAFVEKIFRGLSASWNWWCVSTTMLLFSE